MLSSLTRRSLYRPFHSFRARFLTTYPKPVSPYVKVWDPTAHVPLKPVESSAEWRVATKDATEDDERKIERKQWRDTQGVTIASKTRRLGQRHAIKRLNYYLSLAADTVVCKESIRTQLWRAYALAKRQISGLPSILPDRAWDIIWATQWAHTPQNRSRRSHLEELYRDMNSVGRATTVGQRTAYLESIFLNGKEEQALKEWEEDHSGLSTGSRQDYKPEHLEMGAKLHALAGNADRARAIMHELFDLYSDWDSSIMMSVFRAHTSAGTDQLSDVAKEIYAKMRERMGSKMELQDYDSCLVGFLEARHVRYAKQVFRDMIKDGYLASAFSARQVEEVLERLHLLYRLGTDIEKMTSIALQAISVLPQPYHSHVFKDWMKSAVVKKAPAASAQILDMMYNRGCKPETVHFNLLLKALLRTKDEPHILKAENIGWTMIEESRRSSSKKLDDEAAADIISKKAIQTAETALDSDIARKIPQANVTTFALMMRHHASNFQWEHVDYLARRLKETGIQPNAAVMNVLMDNHCRQGKYSEAWRTYKSLTDIPEGAPGVYPDGATMRCLWKTLRLALGDHATRDDPGLPTPRQLLAEMIHWWTRCRSRYDVERFRMGLAAADHGAITNLMMHCFSYIQDLPGSLVALHVLRKRFDIFPSDKAAEVLQKQTAWVDMHREMQSVRSQYYHSGVNQKNVEKMGRVFNLLMERRFERMNLIGDQFAYMSEEEVGDLGLNLLSEFVRVILKRQYPPEAVEALIDEAKKEIEVSDMPTGDMDAFSVA
ncbi:hypothetical protein BU26DRAFT_515597 [Trematosphaeria pertusa]|uniref:Pentatricopeptide repeat protein n=1 Tax=Trematosphaeria pertusa TaxID=390896 RepID=A0A6A6IRV9_9PLEO|nr:uncharacterized protein BU26DRAFT_515597 [Trematosphaeria pertusa]KAF2253221.1 hypothetical protein BU26DRAFT_515597 [Trematosphaeria pertusa]